jgi:outer membrane lipoprotein-sorting protein
MPRRPILALAPALLSVGLMSFAVAKTEQKKADVDPETKMVLDSLADRYEKLGSWEATFNQTEKSPGFAEEISSEGYFKFVLKNKFHLATQGKTMVKKFVSDGNSAVYVEDKGSGKPADRYFARRFKDAKSLELERYLLFFQGLKKTNAQDDFTVKGKFKKPDLEIVLTPKKESDFSEISIVFHNSETFPKELNFKDALGGETKLKIIEAKKIAKVDPKWFDLSIPKGAKVE